MPNFLKLFVLVLIQLFFFKNKFVQKIQHIRIQAVFSYFDSESVFDKIVQFSVIFFYQVAVFNVKTSVVFK